MRVCYGLPTELIILFHLFFFLPEPLDDGWHPLVVNFFHRLFFLTYFPPVCENTLIKATVPQCTESPQCGRVGGLLPPRPPVHEGRGSLISLAPAITVTITVRLSRTSFSLDHLVEQRWLRASIVALPQPYGFEGGLNNDQPKLTDGRNLRLDFR